MNPTAVIAALEREREQHNGDPDHVALIDEQLAYYKAQPLPASIVTEQSTVVADRTEAYLAALRVEKARYPDRSKEIDKEIEATEKSRGRLIERAVRRPKGVQTADTDTDLPE